MSDLIDDIDTVGEMLHEGPIKINAVSFLLDVQIVVGIVEVVHPVIF
jgi:hypothetical protein